VAYLGSQQEFTYTIFWASMLFFFIPFIEQHIFKEKFADELLKTVLASSHICFNEVGYLLSELDKEQKNALKKKRHPSCCLLFRKRRPRKKFQIMS